MSKQITGDEQIFPEVRKAVCENITSGGYFYEGGLTIRQEFAARAMQGFLSNSEIACKWDVNTLIKSSIKMADALIAELNKEV